MVLRLRSGRCNFLFFCERGIEALLYTPTFAMLQRTLQRVVLGEQETDLLDLQNYRNRMRTQTSCDEV